MIIGINGRVGSGKDTIGAMIRGTSRRTWEVKKFAGKLKQIATLLTGIPTERFEDQDFKKTFLGKEWNYYMANTTETPVVEKQMTVREFLQKLGTEGLRTGLHTETWVNALFADYNPEGYWPEAAWPGEIPNWLITDCRFPNEAQAVKDRGGLVVRVVRPTDNLTDLHPSETSLDSWKFDYVFQNNGTMDDLYKEVKEFINQHKL